MDYTDMDLTEIYKVLELKEQGSPAVKDVAKRRYIDTAKMDELLLQLYLMEPRDAMAVLLAYACPKVVKVYCNNGMIKYHTDKNSNRQGGEIAESDFKRYAKSPHKINQISDKVYISLMMVEKEPYLIEHNLVLNGEDAAKIYGVINNALIKIERVKNKR